MATANARRETKGAAASAEPLLTALEHIEKRGSLLSLVPDWGQRLGLMKALAQQKLVSWNAGAVKYELTGLGQQCLGGLPEAQGGLRVRTQLGWGRGERRPFGGHAPVIEQPAPFSHGLSR